MLSWIVLLLILTVLAMAGTVLWPRVFGAEDVMAAPESPLEVRQHNRAAVQSGDISALTFDVVSFGYRQDQVDEAIAALHSRISELEALQLRPELHASSQLSADAPQNLARPADSPEF